MQAYHLHCGTRGPKLSYGDWAGWAPHRPTAEPTTAPGPGACPHACAARIDAPTRAPGRPGHYMMTRGCNRLSGPPTHMAVGAVINA